MGCRSAAPARAIDTIRGMAALFTRVIPILFVADLLAERVPYTPEELIKEESIPTVPMAHDPGWEKAGAAGTI